MNKIVKNSAIYLTGTIVMASLGFASTIILTRILSNQVYAMYGLLNTFSTAIITFIAFGYDSSYMRFYYNHGYTQKKFMLMSLKIPFFIFLTFSLIVLEPSHTLLNYIFDKNFSLISIILLIMYILFSFFHRFSQLTARMEEYAGNYILSNIIAKSGFLVLTVIAFVVLKEVSFNIVLLSFMISNVVAVLINLKVFAKKSNKISVAEQKVTNKALLRYGVPIMFNNFLVLLIPMIEKLMIRKLAGWEILSIFTAASIFQTVVLLITNTLDSIWQPMVFKHSDNREKFQTIMHIFGLLSSIVIAMVLALCIIARRWLVLLLDNVYFSVYIIAPTILWSACVSIISMIYSIGINIEKKTFHLIIASLLHAGISIVMCYLLIPNMGLIGAGIAILASTIASCMYKIFVGLYYYNTGKLEYESIILFLICTIISISSMFFNSLPADLIMGALIFIFIVILNIKNFSSLLSCLKEIIGK